jgi:hypothetical protein
VARGPEARAFRLALCLAFFDQACASTAVINYAPELLKGMGVADASSATLYTAAIAVTKALGGRRARALAWALAVAAAVGWGVGLGQGRGSVVPLVSGAVVLCWAVAGWVAGVCVCAGCGWAMPGQWARALGGDALARPMLWCWAQRQHSPWPCKRLQVCSGRWRWWTAGAAARCS